MASPNKATLRGRWIISTSRQPKKSGVAETANSKNIFKTGHLSNMGDPLTFYVISVIKHGSLIWLSFVGIRVSSLPFALLSYILK